ncbi:MAG: S26 family signal peptidase [Bacteroidota bacterium]
MSIIANILLLLLIGIYFYSFPKLFEKAGRKKSDGYIPFYNFYVLTKILHRPWWWYILFIIPGVNFLMIFVVNVELARAYNKRKLNDLLKAIFIPWIFIPQMANAQDLTYTGPIDYKAIKKSFAQEWFDALIFAVIAATIIRTFFLEAFKIPTPSMEKNLLVGDFLFVSKVHYGAKIPETPITFPFTHNTLPFFNSKSYLEIFTMPHLRLPGFTSVQRNDVVVFNFPAGDSVFLDKTDRTYYSELSNMAFQNFVKKYKMNTGKSELDMNTIDSMIVYDFDKVKEQEMALIRKQQINKNNIILRPLDKKDNYIKRCVGIPGDVIEVKDRQLYINGEPSGDTELMQFNYVIETGEPVKSESSRRQEWKQQFNVSSTDHHFLNKSTGVVYVPVTNKDLPDFQKKFKSVNPVIKKKGYYYNYGKMTSYPVHDMNVMVEGTFDDSRFMPVFPNDIRYNWTEDNFGPLRIPAEGETVELTLENLPLYRRIIEVYEHNTLEIKGADIFINGEKATSYTFQQNYYWLMGDNRQNSADSRFWGFVPEDHVVGKAVLIWFSSDPETGVRWNRIFKSIE